MEQEIAKAEGLIPDKLPEEILEKKTDYTIVIISCIMLVPFILWGIVSPSGFNEAMNTALNFFTTNFDWSYLLIATGFVVFLLLVAFGKFGKLKLGKADDKPEYSTLSWYAMLFSVGMGIGVLFWGVAEPLYHYLSPPYGAAASAESAEIAMRYSFFHWGIHPWTMFAVVALPMAYFAFRHNMPCSISATFYPLLKEKTWGIIGKIIDAFAIFATIGGVVTSIGLGALQINSGLNFVFDIPSNNTVQLIIIILATIIFTYSALRGVSKGIKIFSEASFYIGIALMLFLLLFGPAGFLLDTFCQSFGAYIQNIIPMSFWTDFIGQSGWGGGWTIFYWAWWIAWAPFVGTFFAKISKGRTIKEFIVGCIFFPTIFDCIWFSIFGGSGLYQEIFKHAGIGALVQQDVSTAVFLLLKQYPLFTLTAILTVIAAASFFINSADAAVFTAGMLTQKGTLEPNKKIKVFWGAICGLAAAVLLFSGGLGALQTASIVAAFPFMIIMVIMCVSLVKLLKRDMKEFEMQELELKELELKELKQLG
jgi:choline/carnitine/betaine transport